MADEQCTLHKLIADVAVFAGDNVALVRYASGYDGQRGWFLPDDELKYLEHPDTAAQRILSEQLGLTGHPARLDHIESFRGNDRSWHLTFHYAVELEAPGTFSPTGNIARVDWFPLNALPERGDVAHHGWALKVISTIVSKSVPEPKTVSSRVAIVVRFA
jgi:ADP-ribose pyrophosphatase YjhB (NUDIX family)